MNIVTLGGRLGKQPVSKLVGEDGHVVNVSLATTDYYGKADPKHTNWHNLVIWGANALFMEKYLDKGSYIVVTGEVRNRQYEQDGVTKYISEVRVRDLDAPKGSAAPNPSDGGQAPAPVQVSAPVPLSTSTPAPAYSPSNHLDEDVPF